MSEKPYNDDNEHRTTLATPAPPKPGTLHRAVGPTMGKADGQPKPPDRDQGERRFALVSLLLERLKRALGLPDAYEASVGSTVQPVVIVADARNEEGDVTTQTPPYRIKVVSLVNALNRDDQALADIDNFTVGHVALLQLIGSGSALSLHVGDGDGIPFVASGEGIDLDPPCKLKWYVTCAAQGAGAQAVLLFSRGVRAAG